MDMVSDRQTIAHCAVWVQQTIPGAAVKELSTQLVNLQQLRQQLVYLQEYSDFYRPRFEAAGLGRSDLANLDRLSDLPFTTKEELRDSQLAAPPLGTHAAMALRDTVRVHSSTGTTGRPSWVGLSRRDAATWTAITARALVTQGLEPSDVVIHATSLALFVGGLPVKDAIESIGATLVPIGTGNSERAVLAARTLGCNVLHSTPSYAVYLADYVREHYDTDPRELGIRKIMVGGEPGGGEPAVRGRIQDDWGARLTEGMGNADIAPIIWAECPHQEGMHFTAAADVAVELIDPASGANLEFEDGAEGELVYTTVNRECSPLLRMRSRDRIVVLGDHCRCGRSTPRIRCVGRTDDMLIVLGVNVFPSAIRDIVAELHPATTGALQILLSRPGPRVEPPLRLVVEYGREAMALPALASQLKELIRGRLQISAAIELVPPDTLPRSEMKTQLIRRLYEEQAQAPTEPAERSRT
jgi:phenylacetate-CoA ligase